MKTIINMSFNQECVICFEKETEICCKFCSIYFHFSCFKKYKNLKNYCPQCQKQLPIFIDNIISEKSLLKTKDIVINLLSGLKIFGKKSTILIYDYLLALNKIKKSNILFEMNILTKNDVFFLNFFENSFDKKQFISNFKSKINNSIIFEELCLYYNYKCCNKCIDTKSCSNFKYDDFCKEIFNMILYKVFNASCYLH